MLIRLFLHFEGLKTIFVDGSYSCSLINWALSMLGWNMQVIKRCQQRIFKALPKRWIVERTFAWLSQSRRFSEGYEVLSLQLKPSSRSLAFGAWSGFLDNF